jgi:rubrerythrin
MSKRFRAMVHGKRIEFRMGDLGGEYVLVDGIEVSSKMFAALVPDLAHRFQMRDEKGVTRTVEVRTVSAKWGFSERVRLMVDGHDRGDLDPVDERQKTIVCRSCGYDLARLEVINGGTKCPECGRHTPVQA